MRTVTITPPENFPAAPSDRDRQSLAIGRAILDALEADDAVFDVDRDDTTGVVSFWSGECPVPAKAKAPTHYVLVAADCGCVAVRRGQVTRVIAPCETRDKHTVQWIDGMTPVTDSLVVSDLADTVARGAELERKAAKLDRLFREVRAVIASEP